MKKIVKLVNINDGNEKEFQNKDRVLIQTYPITEKIITAFLNEKWTLVNRNNAFIPLYKNPEILPKTL